MRAEATRPGWRSASSQFLTLVGTPRSGHPRRRPHRLRRRRADPPSHRSRSERLPVEGCPRGRGAGRDPFRRGRGPGAHSVGRRPAGPPSRPPGQAHPHQPGDRGAGAGRTRQQQRQHRAGLCSSARRPSRATCCTSSTSWRSRTGPGPSRWPWNSGCCPPPSRTPEPRAGPVVTAPSPGPARRLGPNVLPGCPVLPGSPCCWVPRAAACPVGSAPPTSSVSAGVRPVRCWWRSAPGG